MKTEEQRDGVIRHRRRVIPFFFVRQAHDVTRKEARDVSYIHYNQDKKKGKTKECIVSI